MTETKKPPMKVSEEADKKQLELAIFEPVRNFVFVSHTITREGRRKYGEEDKPGAQRRATR